MLTWRAREREKDNGALKIILHGAGKSFSSPLLLLGADCSIKFHKVHSHNANTHTLLPQHVISEKGATADGWMPAPHRPTKSYSGGQQLDYLYKRARRQIHFAAASRFISKARFRLAACLRGRSTDTHLCVWGQLKMHISTLPGTNVMEARVPLVGNYDQYFFVCASARALCPRSGTRVHLGKSNRKPAAHLVLQCARYKKRFVCTSICYTKEKP